MRQKAKTGGSKCLLQTGWSGFSFCVCVFIITDKEKASRGGLEVKGVGVMTDEEIKLEEIEVSHTQGGQSGCR